MLVPRKKRKKQQQELEPCLVVEERPVIPELGPVQVVPVAIHAKTGTCHQAGSALAHNGGRFAWTFFAVAGYPEDWGISCVPKHLGENVVLLNRNRSAHLVLHDTVDHAHSNPSVHCTEEPQDREVDVHLLHSIDCQGGSRILAQAFHCTEAQEEEEAAVVVMRAVCSSHPVRGSP